MSPSIPSGAVADRNGRRRTPPPQPSSQRRDHDAGAGRPHLARESRLALLALAGGLPALLLAAALLLDSGLPAVLRWSLALLATACWAGAAWLLRVRLAYSLGTLANLVEALRRGDFSIRGRWRGDGGSHDALVAEINRLAELLKERRLGALEASTLANKVIAEIDLAVFTFDPEGRLRATNPAGERLLGEPVERLLGRSARQLCIEDLLTLPREAVVERVFPGAAGRWGVRRAAFREGGVPHDLLVVDDLSQALRQEERQAWERLIRVLGHELNNSLAPIQSMAATLRSLLAASGARDELRRDMSSGLDIIEERARALARFTASYARLARLPSPRFERVDVPRLARRVAALETRLVVGLRPGPDAWVEADEAQLEQLLINLVRNAADAALETGGGVEIGWEEEGGALALWVRDEGPGLASTGNLFVPFFTTKRGGTGIGLALCRQIADAHAATLTLESRSDARGSLARLRLPARR